MKQIEITAKHRPIRHNYLPPLTRRGLHRDESAAYVGISPSKFDEMIADGRMPKPKQIDGRKVWDVRALDSAFDDLPGDGESCHDVGDNDGWDEVLK